MTNPDPNNKSQVSLEKRVEELLADLADESIQASVVNALASIGEPVLKYLKPFITSSDITKKRLAVKVLSQLGSLGIEPLIQLLQSTNNSTLQGKIIRSFGSLGLAAYETLSLLEEFRLSSDERLAYRANWAIKTIKRAALEQELNELLTNLIPPVENEEYSLKVFSKNALNISEQTLRILKQMLALGEDRLFRRIVVAFENCSSDKQFKADDLYFLSSYFVRMKRFDEALVLNKLALKAGSKYWVPLYHQQGTIFRFLNQDAKAIACFETALQKFDRSWRTVYALLDLYKKYGRYRDALALIEKYYPTSFSHEQIMLSIYYKGITEQIEQETLVPEWVEE